MPTQQEVNTHKVATIVSLILSLYGNISYFISPTEPGSGFDVGETPFSGSTIVVFVYWILLYILQLSFVLQIFLPNIENARSEITVLVGWHFVIFNVASYLWAVLFTGGHYFWSEVILIINFLNILALYFSHKTFAIKPLTSWTLIHLPLSAFPLSWLLYAIFWNGAVLFRVTDLFGRIIANVLIWDFLLVPGFLLFIFNDWGVGISSTILTFGLAFGQLFTKVFALQWIFAFVISGLLLVFSVIAAVSGTLRGGETIAITEDREAAPLL
ncbi:uncharacterized protein RJT20DRAFT_135556 [Scheffersomyces xylosifermentans]|uniref:uncharacterized protein n=1 Tax=Scheffersomyces xylosifermentans TaxID=1304137 RepID=UPI00315DB8BF